MDRQYKKEYITPLTEFFGSTFRTVLTGSLTTGEDDEERAPQTAREFSWFEEDEENESFLPLPNNQNIWE